MALKYQSGGFRRVSYYICIIYIVGKLTDAVALSVLNKCAIDLSSISNEEDLFWYVSQNVVGRLNFLDCVIYRANTELTELRQVAAWGEKNPVGRSILNPLIIPFGKGITGTVAASKKAMVVGDLLNDQRYILDTQLARSEICVPVLVNGNVVGVIDSEHPDPNAFGDAKLEVLMTIAAMMGAKLELFNGAQRYESLLSLHRDLTEAINTQKAVDTEIFESRKMEAIGRLTGKFAHEFNNLSTTILGNLELLSLEELSSEGSTFLEAALTSAQLSVRLMRKMSAFAQRTRLVPTVTNLNSIVLAVCEANVNSFSRTVELDLEKIPWSVSVDPSAIETILLDLIKNAEHAVMSGGTIHINTKNVLQLSLDSATLGYALLNGSCVQLTVTDTGHGIPQELLSQIFEPYFTTKTIGTGSGLGLSVVKGLTQQSGGHVSVRSELGKGSIFELTFPALRDCEKLS